MASSPLDMIPQRVLMASHTLYKKCKPGHHNVSFQQRPWMRRAGPAGPLGMPIKGSPVSHSLAALTKFILSCIDLQPLRAPLARRAKPASPVQHPSFLHSDPPFPHGRRKESTAVPLRWRTSSPLRACEECLVPPTFNVQKLNPKIM